jgi:hypothetical protein
MRRVKGVNLVLLAVSAGLTLALLVRVALTSNLDVSPCGRVPPAHGVIAPAFYAASALLSFIAGGLWQFSRSRGGGELAIPRGEVLVEIALVLLLATAAVALGYETYALISGRVWPITYYVRCANVVDPGWTLLGLVVSSGLFGHWLWSPLRRT